MAPNNVKHKGKEKLPTPTLKESMLRLKKLIPKELQKHPNDQVIYWYKKTVKWFSDNKVKFVPKDIKCSPSVTD
jgi:hypothetical protein